MKKIKNSNGKTICAVDALEKVVEIVFKGVKTVIKFKDNGDVEVVNNNIA